MMITTMTTTMTPNETSTAIMITVVLSLLGSGPLDTVLLSEKVLKKELVQVSKSKTLFLTRTGHKVQMNKKYVIYNLTVYVNLKQKLKTKGKAKT